MRNTSFPNGGHPVDLHHLWVSFHPFPQETSVALGGLRMVVERQKGQRLRLDRKVRTSCGLRIAGNG